MQIERACCLMPFGLDGGDVLGNAIGVEFAVGGTFSGGEDLVPGLLSVAVSLK